MRAIFFDEESAQTAVARLLADGFQARAEREPFAGEDDDEDHPWAVLSDAPAFLLEMILEQYDGWLDEDAGQPPSAPPLDLPVAPKRIKRSDLG